MKLSLGMTPLFLLSLLFFVELTIIKSEPGVKGDTVSGANKTAELETGVSVQVPLFVNEGEKIKVDTRTESYVSRA